MSLCSTAWHFLVHGVAAMLFWSPAWLVTRPLHFLFAALPAILLSGAVLLIVLLQPKSPEDVVVRYQSAVARALQERDMSAAEVYALKLAQLDESSCEARFALARVAEEKNDQAQAEQLMAQLAPANSSGYARAHFWIAQRILRQKRDLDATQTKLVIHHLRESLHSHEERETASILLAEVHAARHRFQEAVACLEPLVEHRPDLRLKLAQLYAAMGDEVHMRRQAKLAVEHFRSDIDRKPHDVQARLLLAQAHATVDDFAEAESVLRAGIDGPNDRIIRRALSRLYLAMAERLRRSDGSVIEARLELLQKALSYDSANPDALGHLAELAGHSGPASDEVRRRLEDALAAGKAPATVHLVLGTNAAVEGRWERAKLHLEQSYRVNPDTPTLLNNLAWVVAHTEPADFERALHLADRAVELSPDHPEIRQTRGTILVRLKRWSESLTDLELALRHFSDRPQLHRLLADVYSHLGDPDLARKHQLLADQDRADTSAPSRDSRTQQR